MTSPLVETRRDRFNQLADRITHRLGSFGALAASVIVVVWATTGPLFNFSDSWQLLINTGTTVVTFWMVFVIQNSANRDSKAVHLKLDEIIRSIEGARNTFITLEGAPEEVLDKTQAALADLAAKDHRDPAGATVARVDTGRRHGASRTRRGSLGDRGRPPATPSARGPTTRA